MLGALPQTFWIVQRASGLELSKMILGAAFFTPFNQPTLISMSNPSTGLKGLWIAKWKFNCSINSNSLFRITSEAFSRSPLILATNCWIETLNSSTLHARYMQVTLKHTSKVNLWKNIALNLHYFFRMVIHHGVLNVKPLEVVKSGSKHAARHWRLKSLAEVLQEDFVVFYHRFLLFWCEEIVAFWGILKWNIKKKRSVFTDECFSNKFNKFPGLTGTVLP